MSPSGVLVICFLLFVFVMGVHKGEEVCTEIPKGLLEETKSETVIVYNINDTKVGTENVTFIGTPYEIGIGDFGNETSQAITIELDEGTTNGSVENIRIENVTNGTMEDMTNETVPRNDSIVITKGTATQTGNESAGYAERKKLYCERQKFKMDYHFVLGGVIMLIPYFIACWASRENQIALRLEELILNRPPQPRVDEPPRPTVDEPPPTEDEAPPKYELPPPYCECTINMHEDSPPKYTGNI